MMAWLRRLAAARFRISTQLYAGIAAAAAFTMMASLVAWFSFDRVGDAQALVNERSVPEMDRAFRIAQRAGTLVAAAPRLVAAATPAELGAVTSSIRGEREAFERNLAELVGEGEDYAFIREHGAALMANIDSIENSLSDRFALAERSSAVGTELAAVQDELEHTLVPAIDDQLFYTITGFRSLGEPRSTRAEHLSEPQISRYRRLASLQADAGLGIQILASVFNLADAALIEPQRDRFLATVGGIERNLAAVGDADVAAAIGPPLARLRELGLGEEGGFAIRARELALSGRQQELLAANRDLATQLVSEVEDLVSVAGDRAGAATQAAAATINTGRVLLLALNVLSIAGAVLIAWLFVGRVLLRRIEALSERMRGMAEGDLEAQVDIAGHDEVADMAKALEVFRRHALEVQRLNLVEKLAEELRGKNDQLETALTDLKRVQDQMVAQEKLAALGELTAGVAHEIKNPLNFVKNFSEASEELIDELKETLEELAEKLDEEQRDLITEISQDLVENMGRIRHHGERADRIVRDMLVMGRDSGERAETDINALVHENTQLAFQAARAMDSDFQLSIDEDLDDKIEHLQVVPQDLGRVFLNMVTNACYATDERATKEAAAGNKDFKPTLRITTRRLEDTVEVAIRDNGGGIPKDVVDKIFNPFFTTKPTDKGTGLGLALSNDIVRQHGGSIRVATEAGDFTEMTVTLPLEAPALSTEEEGEEGEGEEGEAAEPAGDQDD